MPLKAFCEAEALKVSRACGIPSHSKKPGNPKSPSQATAQSFQDWQAPHKRLGCLEALNTPAQASASWQSLETAVGIQGSQSGGHRKWRSLQKHILKALVSMLLAEFGEQSCNLETRTLETWDPQKPARHAGRKRDRVVLVKIH